MKNAAAFARRNTIRLARGLRDAWLIVGVTIGLLLFIELTFRAQRMVRSELADTPASSMPPDPFEASKWWKDYWVDHEREGHVVWEPYVYIRNPTFNGNIISVDSLGHRVTPMPATTATRPIRVFFFGGSTTYGWYQRNENTIPAEASRRLQAALGADARVEPTNFGVPGRVFTQEMFELILQLRGGARPDVVVFYDGINDVLATIQNGRAGLPQNEWNRVDDFVRGREFAQASAPGIVNDGKWAKIILGLAARRSEFARLIKAHALPGRSTPLLSTDSAVSGIVNAYAANVPIVEALAKKYGFQVIYVWQPALLSDNKPLSKREKWMLDADMRMTITVLRKVHAAVPRLIGDAVRPMVGSRFIDATSVFSDDSSDVYVDLFGHTYESANPRIVDSLMPQLSAAARSALH